MSFADDSHRPQNQPSQTIDAGPSALTSMREDYTTEQNTTRCFCGASDSDFAGYSVNAVDEDSRGGAIGE